MQVFHGSYTEIEAVDLSRCQANKDFGRGFYVTKFRKQAEEWAEIIGKVNGTIGVVTEYIFYERAFTEEFANVEKTNYKPIIRIEDIGELIVEKLVIDFDFDEQMATDKFFSSNTFADLADTKTGIYEKDWNEIYKLLLSELKW